MSIWALIIAAMLALVHLFGHHMTFLRNIPRSRWLSLAGGASIAYIFVHLLPELQEHQENYAASGPFLFLEHHVYFIALGGLVLYYGMERAALTSQASRREHKGETADMGTDPGEIHPTTIFYLHIAFFVVYNFIIGYTLLAGEREGFGTLGFYGLAMALHFLVNDVGLYDHYAERYKHRGRWMLAAAVVLGVLTALFLEISDTNLAVLFGFIAGSTILNVLKEELPEYRRSNFWAFLTGVVLYAGLLLLAA